MSIEAGTKIGEFVVDHVTVPFDGTVGVRMSTIVAGEKLLIHTTIDADLFEDEDAVLGYLERYTERKLAEKLDEGSNK